VFSKDGVITVRDLLKWTGREFRDKGEFVREGYAIFVERIRGEEERKFV
jgi:midasin (ATPase involved in ribosome maturation)